MTYLELVNNVLTRLREDNVSTVNQNSYSALIGTIVNDAKEIVQNAWDWSQLTLLTEVTQASDTVELADFGDTDFVEGIKVGDNWLKVLPRTWIDDMEPKTGEPEYYAFIESATDGDLIFKVYPTPASSVTFKIYTTDRRGLLENDSDVTRLPHMPIIHFALALAARERGENGGTTVQEYFSIAQNSLSDAIAYDSGRNPDKTIWYTV